jgi:septum site-determining protein MinC
MGKEGITFKGSTGGLAILVPEGSDAQGMLREVEAKIQSAARFFKGARLKVTYRGITLNPDEEARLFRILDEQSGAVIESLSPAPAAAPVPNEPYGPNTNAAPQRAVSQPLRRFFSKGQDESDCKFVRSTLRGGTRIQYEGSVVVVGDVNPGAEVVAGGNVIVLGLLRGMVHAGASGSRDAFITALKLKPTQLRIADLIARCPDDPDAPGCYPEIASVRDGLIEVAPLYDRNVP